MEASGDVEIETERLRRLQLVTDAALAHLDLEALLPELLARTRDALQVETCLVLLLDRTTNELVTRAAVGVDDPLERGLRIPVGRGFAGTIAATRKPVILRDVDHADVLSPVLREKGIRSMLGVPLVAAGEVLGVLHVGSLHDREFTDTDVELLQLTADRAAIAIEHARAFEAERQARERIEHIQSLTDEALALLDVDALMGVLLPRIRDILRADTCAVLLLDEETGELVARAAVGIEEEVERGVRIPLGGGFAGTVAAQRQAVILNDVDHSNVLNPILREKGIKSLLGVPLVVGGSVLGVLHVGTLTERRFGRDDIELLQIAADRTALAIEHARLYEAEHRARLRIEHVQAVTDAALAHLEIDDLLRVLLPRIRDILGADTCAVLLLDEEAGELVARAALGIEEEVEQGVRVPLGKGFAGNVAARRRPIVLPDVDTADIWNPILREKGLKSMIGVPLLVAGEVLGVLHVGVLQHRAFTTDDVDLLQLVAERVAIAIERARVHEETVMLDQLKANFVAVASHELRTPAAAVYGALATVFERSELPEDVRERLLRTAYEQADRLRLLLEQLLDLSRLDDHSLVAAPRPIAVRALLREIVAGTVPEGTEVRVEVDESLAANADPLIVERVLSNLLTNAVRYGAAPLVVSAAQSDRHLRLTVEDHGPGVAPELVPHLFERFTRGENARGTGLGLAIARAYAHAHGGDLLYEQRDAGARFELVIPQAQGARPA